MAPSAQSPSAAEIARLKTRLRRAKVQSIAICFLHAYRNPANEKRVAAALEGLGYLCSSHDVCPEFREYERSSTTLINAYVGPLMDQYLGRTGARAAVTAIAIMQSNGGFMSTKEARRHAVRTVLSGPAGGVVGALEVAKLSGFSRILGFDMGGTSTDVSLCDGAAARNTGSIHRRLFRCACRCSTSIPSARAAAPSRAWMKAACCAWVRRARAPIPDRPATAKATGLQSRTRTLCWGASRRTS